MWKAWEGLTIKLWNQFIIENATKSEINPIIRLCWSVVYCGEGEAFKWETFTFISIYRKLWLASHVVATLKRFLFRLVVHVCIDYGCNGLSFDFSQQGRLCNLIVYYHNKIFYDLKLLIFRKTFDKAFSLKRAKSVKFIRLHL